jgi:outer membrane lipoprotein carrier protein
MLILSFVFGVDTIIVSECFASLSPVEVAQNLQKTYEQTKSIAVDFRQITSTGMSRRVRRGSGTMVIVKPGKMRWDYKPPEPQVIICDGETITMYFENSRQMVTGAAKDYLRSDITYSFFTGKGNFLKDFDVFQPDVLLESDMEADGEESYPIKLVPKEMHPQVDYLHVWVDKKSFMIKRLQIVDQFGSITNLVFSNIKVNQKFPADYFSFTPPPDTEVIQQ